MTSGKWWYGIVLSLICWIIAAGITEEIVPYGTAASVTLGSLILFAWVLMPIATYLDIRHVRQHNDWQPKTWFWVFAAVIWLVNIFTGFSYLARRYRYVGL